ncbi:putative toll-like receptor, P-loop containing nucleoside triphosphate hydrolase [Medicago truncatula]|uniref:Disease resistance protein (TIR-NBS-LRR class), putative n=1 Tax=Medicago truncatula TaxID=3880 RepID=A0A072TNR3_MEDTR|nr:disease resistance protein RML1A isoform X2 [Medicago truncatula]KEH18463.1 disease resistance protein (TIR-NBS-LRR class), putative [Medicago truncatula]RHN39417.1 putative toll-like receptor, P-loop containing nucleoside triphosphate hydrolase [Medicago truncatula]
MKNCESSSSISLLVFLTFLVISEPRGVGSSSSIIPKPISNKYYYPTCPVAFSHPSSNSIPEIKHDVFVSFRGEDTRRNFLSHVLVAFSRKQINVFSDKKLEEGDEISPKLNEAIEKSFIHLVIFSPNFSYSHWCLDELVKIVDCRAKYDRILLPVFYQVDPTEVRHQTGAYKDAFVQLGQNFSSDKVEKWRHALTKSANISGFHSIHFPDDAKLVEKTVESVLMKLKQVEGKLKGLVGIEKQISLIESSLHLELQDVRVLRIWGRAGIGKTTLAEEVYRRLHSKYDSFCFMANVREESERSGTNNLSLRKKLLSTLLEEENTKDDLINELQPLFNKRLRRMKVLIVLDDVKDAEQLEVLVGTLDWFGPGSRIIITTGVTEVLVGKTNDTYKVQPLDSVESLLLFNLHAFAKHKHNEMEYRELSERMVDLAEGVPQVLTTLGKYLCGKDKAIWESLARNIKIGQTRTVHDVSRLMYTNLDYHEKNIFLDIACFFDGMKMKLDIIKLLLKDPHYSVSNKLDKLKNEGLVTISQQSIVSMDDITQETAWEIVRNESFEEPGNRSRLSDPNDIYNVLKDDKGGESIRSMAIRLSEIKELQLSPQVFAKTSKLKFLDIYTKRSQNEGSLSLPGGLEFLPNELRYLRWEYYPLKSLPSMFSAENLITLCLPYSRLNKLWHGEKDLVNLNDLILHSSTLLTELPDLSKATSLAVMDLQFCVGLTSVHPSVFSLKKLKKLDLSGCISLTSLQSNTQLISLSDLSLYNCTSLKEFSVTSKNMKKLNLERTSIKQVPSSIGLQTKLEKLHLGHTHIESLPKSIKNLTRLRHLDLHHCRKLQTLPELPPSIETLDAGGCVSLENVEFRSTASEQLQEKRKRVTFWNCLKINEPSLKAIELNAKINMMNFSHQHISTCDLDHDHDRNQGMYVYPGSEIPEWLEYSASATRHDYIAIDLSSSPYFSKLGFIFGFIIPTISSEGSILKFKISDGEDEGIKVYLDRPHHGIESDHVYLLYDPRCSHYLARRVNNQLKIKIQVSAFSRTLTSRYMPVQLRGFGVSLVTPSDYDKFKQKLEFGDGSVVPENSMCSVEERSMLL